MVLAYLGVGSNLGNRLAFMRGGRDFLCAKAGIELEGASAVYETEPQGGPADSPLFLNAVLAVRTSLSPRELLEACRAVEDEFGRVRSGTCMPRTLDIDILLYDDRIVDEEDLQIPHPRLHERLFVMIPLYEIAPDCLHPQLHETIGDLIRQFDGGKAVELLRSTW
jgi:2-amino-4-hydroxy-6-hydroxymethyldihydropteridine diphosphokinase